MVVVLWMIEIPQIPKVNNSNSMVQMSVYISSCRISIINSMCSTLDLDWLSVAAASVRLSEPELFSLGCRYLCSLKASVVDSSLRFCNVYF